jgi:hypothetical protein
MARILCSAQYTPVFSSELSALDKRGAKLKQEREQQNQAAMPITQLRNHPFSNKE